MNAPDRLLAAYLDGELTTAERDELRAWLHADPANMQRFVDANLFDQQIREAVQGEALRDGANAFSAGDSMAPASSEPVVASRTKSRGGALLATAACLLIGFVWWNYAAVEPAAYGVAVLSRAVDAQWGEGREAYATGSVLPPGLIQVKSGAIQIEFYSGARVVIEGPAELQLVSSGEGFLRSGRITAHVPPQAHGFKIDTAGATVVDHGTDFGVAVQDGATTEVHVFQGKVEIATTGKATESRSLTGGEAARVADGVVQNIPTNEPAFLNEVELARRDELAAERRLATWRKASRTLSADPAMLIHYDFDDESPTERFLLNRATSASEDSQGSIVGCERRVGRWPKKNGLQFRNEGDRVRLTVAQPLQQVSLLTWIQIDSLPHGLQSLLTADLLQTGAVRWELSDAGRLRFAIGRDLGRSKLDWEAVDGEPVVTPDRFGKWLLLATTFDGRTVRHYCNGRPCGSGAAFQPPALQIGAADLGNWRGPTLRNVVGTIDEFAILSRALSAAELQAYYEQGRP
jgi:ferric-dicitrate binding protein FerR (iron transport regulator)